MMSRCIKLYRSYSISFNSSNLGNFFWSWVLKDCIEVQKKKEEESRCLVFTSSTKGEIRHFHVVVVQWRQRNVQKSVMHVQSCCFANVNLLLFCRPRCRRRRRCLSSVITSSKWSWQSLRHQLLVWQQSWKKKTVEKKALLTIKTHSTELQFSKNKMHIFHTIYWNWWRNFTTFLFNQLQWNLREHTQHTMVSILSGCW